MKLSVNTDIHFDRKRWLNDGLGILILHINAGYISMNAGNYVVIVYRHLFYIIQHLVFHFSVRFCVYKISCYVLTVASLFEHDKESPSATVNLL